MLQFLTSTVFLHRESSQKKFLPNNKLLNKNLPKSHSYSNLGANGPQNLKKNDSDNNKLPKKSLKDKNHQKQNSLTVSQKKTQQKLQNKNCVIRPIFSKQKKTQSFIKSSQTKMDQRQFGLTFRTGFCEKMRQKQTQQRTFLKKRIIRNTNKAQKYEKGVFTKKSQSFFKRQFLNNTVNFVQTNSQDYPEIEELYYIDELKRELAQMDKYEEDQTIPSTIVAHFFQSISTFYRFKNVTKPEQSHLSVFLPKQKKHKTTLIFDMDETLIHAEPYRREVHADTWGENIQIKLDDGSTVLINLKIRPFALEVLKRLKTKFQIGIFTAAHENYAKQILQTIDPQQNLFDFFLFRQHCHVVEGKLAIKDLRILGNRSLKNTILIDNSPHTCLYQPQNALPMISFYHEEKDQQILKLEKYLYAEGFQKRQDVRAVLKKRFQFHRYTQFQDVQTMVDTLYGKLV